MHSMANPTQNGTIFSKRKFFFRLQSSASFAFFFISCTWASKARFFSSFLRRLISISLERKRKKNKHWSDIHTLSVKMLGTGQKVSSHLAWSTSRIFPRAILCPRSFWSSQTWWHFLTLPNILRGSVKSTRNSGTPHYKLY